MYSILKYLPSQVLQLQAIFFSQSTKYPELFLQHFNELNFNERFREFFVIIEIGLHLF